MKEVTKIKTELTSKFNALKRNDKYKSKLRGWKLNYDTAVSRFAVCRFSKKEISISQVLIKYAGRDESIDTLLHEIAHVLAGLDANHNAVWKSFAKELGARPKASGPSIEVPKK